MKKYPAQVQLRNYGIAMIVFSALLTYLVVAWPNDIFLKRFLLSMMFGLGLMLVIKSSQKH